MDIRSPTVLFTTFHPEFLLRSFVDRLRSRWPNLCYSIDSLLGAEWVFNQSDIEKCWGALPVSDLTEVYCFRDPAVKSYFDEAGEIELTMERAFLSVCLRLRRGINFVLGSVDEGEPEVKCEGSVELYRAYLCAPQLLEITLNLPSQTEIADEVLRWTIILCKSGT